MRFSPSLIGILDRQRGHLFPWAPVALACGIGTYFSLPREPEFVELLVLIAMALGACLFGLVARAELRPLIAVIALFSAGIILGVLRANDVASEKLSYRFYGPIEGRIVAIDRSQSDAVRLTLDQVVLGRIPLAKTPAKVRISLHGDQGYFVPRPGQTIGMTGHLSPPSGPVEPGGYDFQRHAWFQGIGAVGYTRTPVLLMKSATLEGMGLWITSFRMRISRAVQQALPGRSGAFAAAVTTGDRSGMDQDVLVALRASNLAHLLAISGLHMGLLTGFIFTALRYGLALVPSSAARFSTKKIAAVVAVLSGAIYLALSGGNVATERAFIMVSVMFVAVLADRRAITLRAVAIAALIVLVLRPESLLSPGFQMSFAATTALVTVFGWMRDAEYSDRHWPKPLRIFASVAISSAIAGLATAPIAAAHFNQMPHYGLLANILSVPLMAAVVIPGAVLAAVLWPVGLQSIGLLLMKPAILWILAVAETIAGFPGALSLIPAPSSAVVPLMALSGLWVAVWRGWGKSLGGVGMAAAMVLWAATERPPVLIGDSGGLVGILTVDGRALSKP